MIILDPETERHLYGKWLPLFYDPETCKETLFCETEDGKVMTQTITDVEALVEQNKAALNDSEGQRWGDGKVVASIDMPTYYNKIVPAKQNGDDAYIKRFLNDPDNRAYRTFKGNI
jgi:hypothetical protein